MWQQAEKGWEIFVGQKRGWILLMLRIFGDFEWDCRENGKAAWSTAEIDRAKNLKADLEKIYPYGREATEKNKENG